MRQLSLGLVVAVLVTAWGGSEEDPTQPESVSASANDLVCDEVVSFHTDPDEGFVGEDTPEEAIAGTPAEYGTPVPASEDGSVWVIFDEGGMLVGRIEVVSAPGGGFMTGEHELCAYLDAEGEQRRAEEEEAAVNAAGFLLVVLRPDVTPAEVGVVAETAMSVPGVFGDNYEEGMGLDGAFENLDADIERDRPELFDCLFPTRVIVISSDSGPTSQAVADAVRDLPGVLGFIGGNFDLTQSLDQLTANCG